MGYKSVKKKNDSITLAEAHRGAGRLKEAFRLFRQILDDEPKNLDALVNLTKISLEFKQVDGASSLILRALTCDPVNDHCLVIFDEVLAAHEEKRSQAQLVFEYSQILKENGFWDNALQKHRQALRLDPTLANTDKFDSISLLAQGDLEKGWLAFEWRDTIGSLGLFTNKVWNGESLRGRTIFILGEQGVGDQIMFSTCLQDVIEVAGLVIIGTDDRLVSLFQRSFPQAVVQGVARYTADGKIFVQDFYWLEKHPPIDFFILQGSLGRFFRPSVESFPSLPRRLLADRERVEYWRQKLTELGPGKKIGISWRSHLVERQSECYPELSLWQPLLTIKGTHFICLQAGVTAGEVQMIKKSFGLDITTFDEIDLIDDLDDISALCGALDSVVTTRVALQWLAAATGTPVWSISRGTSKNEWSMLGLKNYPWFPQMKVCIEESDELLKCGFELAAKEIFLQPN